jgi:diguanylate cyclase (GGDEF)-like protein/PAS domain S-box-containing protein
MRPRDILSSIGIRLFIAFGIVSAATVLAGLVAFVSFTQLGDTVDTLTIGTLPAIEASLDVVDKSSDISAAGPAVLAAMTREEAAAKSAQIVGEQQQLLDAVARLSSRTGAGAKLAGYAAQMRRQLDTLAGLVDQRFGLKSALQQSVGQITAAQRDIAESLAPLLDDAVFETTMELSPGRTGDAADLERRVTHARDIELLELEDLHNLRAESNRLTGLLTAAAIAPTREMLTPLLDSATAASQQIARASAGLPELNNSVKLRDSLDALQGFMRGNQTVFELRTRELGVVASAEAVLATNRVLAGELEAIAREVVRDEHAAAREAAQRGHHGIAVARLALLGIAGFSFVVSILITWLYVARRVVRRLTGLASAMHDLAKGDTGIAIPGRGERDEIGAMAAALDVFRGHQIENLRLMAEREQQRQEAEESRRAALVATHAAQETTRLRQLSDSTFEGLLIHRDGRVLDANTAFCGMTGLTLAQVKGQPLARFAATWTDALDGPVDADGARMREIMVTIGDGETMPVEVRSRDIVYAGGPARVTALRDIRERLAAEDRIRFLAHHDMLTGLANRFQLNDIATRELASCRRTGKMLGVMCIDLDRFKSVNDTLGHDAGDVLLRKVAERIRETARETDIAARIGGDEFILIQTGLAHVGDAEGLARRLIGRLSEPYLINDNQITIGASIGVAIHPRDGDQVDMLLKRADLALYRVKSEGRGDICLFEEGMDTVHRERREMELDLAHAVRTGQIEVAFQPIFGAQSGEVISFEALARWTHPTRGVVTPDRFIPLAEETNLIIPLGEWVLETACRAALTWQPRCRVAVNVSPRQFSGSDMPAMVAAVLERTGLPASRLELEVTESLLITNTGQALQALEALKRIGVRIVLDDFGTGYSSLSYLQRFPFDKIKVDKSFIDGLTSDRGAQTIVAAILAMSHQLNVNVTAEGVETRGQLALLRSEQCDEIQGFLLGRPMRSELVESYLAEAFPAGVAEKQLAGV